MSSGAFLTGISAYGWALFLTGWARMGLGDWSRQRVAHAELRLWAGLLAAGYAALAAGTGPGAAWTGASLPAGWWRELAWHAASSAAAAALLWQLRVWPAGDVKLFALLALLAPLLRLPEPLRGRAQFLETLINVFVPAAAYLLAAASAYLWRTRFAHAGGFLRELGPARAPSFLAQRLRALAAALGEELGERARAYREDPRRLAFDAASWIVQMVVISLLAYQVGAFVQSHLLRALLCLPLYLGWGRVSAALGQGRATALAAGGFALAAARSGGVDWAELARVFSHVSVFSLFIFFGIQAAARAVAGDSAALLLPFVFLLWGLIPTGGAWLQGAGTWALMGLLFGLALVFVRIWDAESHPSVRPEQIEPYMTPGPRLVALIEADPDFRERHFASFYADGLTREQARVLRAWCRVKGVEQVPLAPTISFANWIYLGYFLSALLRGHVLRGGYS